MRPLLIPLLAALASCTPPGGDHPEESTPHTSDTDAQGSAVAPWPDWAWGHWIWEGESTQESALQIAQDYLDHDIPVDAIILDSPWADGYNTFVFDPVKFPDPQAMIDTFHAQGIRVMLWVVPAMNTDVPDWQEGKDKGYFMLRNAQDDTGGVTHWWKGDGSLIDYWNPEAMAWWHAKVDQALALGIDGWKCDGLDINAATLPYSPGAGRNITRTEYANAYYTDFFERTRDALGEDRVITARPVDTYGATPGHNAALLEFATFAPREINWAGWVGDQDGTFDGLKAAFINFRASAQLGFVGFGADIGGYRTDHDAVPLGRTKELFVRWAQSAAYLPVMENGGGGEHRPWMFDEETTELYRAAVKRHAALLDDMKAHGARAFAQGESLVTFLDEADDYRYLLGPDIFVAPILSPLPTRTFDVHFPDEGTWVWIDDPQQVFEAGATVTLDMPLSRYPAFIRQGSPLLDRLTSH